MKAIKILLVLAVTVAALGIAGPASAGGTTAPHRAGRIACGTFPGRHIEVGDPKMHAVDTTDSVDRQWVSYKPVVFRWDGEEWLYYATDGWMKGRAKDNAKPRSWFDEGTQEHLSPIARAINVEAGYYKVALRYRWHATKHVGGGSDYRWVPHYTNPDGTTSDDYCTIG